MKLDKRLVVDTCCVDMEKTIVQEHWLNLRSHLQSQSGSSKTFIIYVHRLARTPGLDAVTILCCLASSTTRRHLFGRWNVFEHHTTSPVGAMENVGD